MDGHAYSRLLSDGHDRLQEVFEVVPHPLRRHLAVVSEGVVLDEVVVEGRLLRAAASGCALGGANAVAGDRWRTKVVADRGYARGPHVAEARAKIVDLLVASGQAQLDLVRPVPWHVLDSEQPESGALEALPEHDELKELEVAIVRRHAGIPADGVGRPKLRAERQLLIVDAAPDVKPESHVVPVAP